MPALPLDCNYSLDWGDAHIVSLDTNLIVDAVRSERMLAWLNADLQSTRKPWKIVFFHHTPYDPARGSEPETRLTRELIVGVAGNVVADIAAGGRIQTVTLALAAGTHKVSAMRVYATNTTATGLKGVY